MQCDIQMLHFHLFSLLLHCVRCCRLGTTSRDNHVQPVAFEMFNTIGSSVSLSAAQYNSHWLCVCVCQCTHTGTWLIILGTARRDIFSTDSPGWTLLILCDVWVCICAWMRVWMQLGATYYGFPSELSLKPDCNPFCLHVNTLGIPAASVCVLQSPMCLYSILHKNKIRWIR